MLKYSIQVKCQIIKWLRRQGENVAKTSREFGIDRKNIRDWKTFYAELKGYDRYCIYFGDSFN